MGFRSDLDAAKIKLAQLEAELALLDRGVREREDAIAAKDAELLARMPTEGHRVRIRQLEAAIRHAREETADLRRRASEARAASRPR